MQGGWNVTGDTFSRDEDGYFWYHARSDDMIISSGYNIAAPEVEEALLKHAEVTECAVVGVPDEARGSLVKAYVVLADPGRGRPREGARAAGLRQGRDRAVQVSAGDRVRRRAAADRDREAAAVPAAAGGLTFVDPAPRQLILSLYGLYARDEGNWLSVASLIALMADLGVDSPAVRSSVSRLKRRGVLEPASRGGQAGYALSAGSLAVLREGDRRIWSHPRATAADGWLVVVFSVPESSGNAGMRCARCSRGWVSGRRRRESGWLPRRCTTRRCGRWTRPG